MTKIRIRFGKIWIMVSCIALSSVVMAQDAVIAGIVTDETGNAIAGVSVRIHGTGAGTDSSGRFDLVNLPAGAHSLFITHAGYLSLRKTIRVGQTDTVRVNIQLEKDVTSLGEIVVTGTMKEVRRSESPVPVEIISAKLFRRNPSPALIDAVGMISGVQAQVNCNVCNTADIRINGMEGPYTLILIDGMPIVSALSTVYGLSGIPISLIEQVEVVKGPGSSLYGSEAMGGIINIITRHPEEAARLSLDAFASTWGEINTDLSMKIPGKKATGLLGVNYFNYSSKIDNNRDGFTDLALQDRISIFNKWQFSRKENRQMSLAARYVYEDRWGGQTNWSRQWRGSDSIYGESVYTSRWELLGAYQLPVKEKIFTQFSFNRHDQNSFYGITPYIASQQVYFGQVYWDKPLGKKQDLLLGASYRYTVYDDNTTATLLDGKNKPATTILPGFFLQDDWRASNQSRFLFGYRYDYDRNHGSVHSPRIAYKWSPNRKHNIRASLGTGYRVVNLFTEDHAALTGSRKVEILEALLPEKSWNANLNYVYSLPLGNGILGFDLTGFYTHFSNRIIANLDIDPDKIIYANLDGYAVSRGVSLNSTASFVFPLKLSAGWTYMDVYQHSKGADIRQLYAPEWSGNYTASYTFPGKITADLTGRTTGPMRLPVQRNDFRPAYSPWYSIVNIQLAKTFSNGIEVYGGVKNLFDFVPEYALIRAFDPFDKNVADPVNNPDRHTFDTEYNYAPLQGIRGFLGMRYTLK
ncbi:MAG: TonB-dependent receptor [Chitinophagaceae bacterium]|nr:MAG: TonB-dependent receptor [Chitinophagaceae bacterium]